MSSAPEATTRPPGRPRSAVADGAILDATLELFAELGFEGLSVEGVAGRAGVSKATIYRRYPSKIDLVMAACENLVDASVAPPPDTGSLRGDIEGIIDNLLRVVTGTVAGRALPQMISETVRTPELAAAHRAFVAERRKIAIAAVQRGIDRGEVRAGADVEVAADLVAGPVFYRHLVSGAPLDRRFVAELVESVVRVLAP